jgi:hypothetical protein
MDFLLIFTTFQRISDFYDVQDFLFFPDFRISIDFRISRFRISKDFPGFPRISNFLDFPGFAMLESWMLRRGTYLQKLLIAFRLRSSSSR